LNHLLRGWHKPVTRGRLFVAVSASSTGLAACSAALAVPDLFASTSAEDVRPFDLADSSRVRLAGLPSFLFAQRL
jgi:hypothetical protein